MIIPPWREEPIRKQHNRDAFDCGEPDLNEFLRRYARRSHDLGGAKTFVAVSKEDGRVLGFYTLSPASIDYERTPATLTRGLGRYEVPVFRLARLAVDRTVQQGGLGVQLLFAAGRRCIQIAGEVGGVALLIDAKNDRVAKWYQKHGAMPLLDGPLALVLPLKSIADASDAARSRPSDRMS